MSGQPDARVRRRQRIAVVLAAIAAVAAVATAYRRVMDLRKTWDEAEES